jgi:hypothetical protein
MTYKETDRLNRAIALDANPGTVDALSCGCSVNCTIARKAIFAIVEGIDTTIGASDWPEIVERVQSEFYQRNGSEAIVDARTRLVQSLIDTDGVSGSVARAAITRYDDAWQSFQENGLSGPISMWRDSASRASSLLLGSSTSDFAPRADVKAVDVCIGLVFAELLIASIACFFIPYCWCCYIITLNLLLRSRPRLAFGIRRPLIAKCILTIAQRLRDNSAGSGGDHAGRLAFVSRMCIDWPNFLYVVVKTEGGRMMSSRAIVGGPAGLRTAIKLRKSRVGDDHTHNGH